MRSLIFCIVFAITLFGSINVHAQCEQKIGINTKVVAEEGVLDIILQKNDSYKCVLYAYENGKKIEIEKKSGNDRKIIFRNLGTKRFYRVEITFNGIDDNLCRGWSSELIQFKQ